MNTSVASVPRNLALWTSTSDLARTRWVVTDPEPPLQPGQARLDIDLVALTANNVTYGAFGESMHYWDFFPTGEAGWGQIPTWGFATVSASQAPGVEVGTRVYGYLPMARTLVVTPGKAGPGGFADAVPHRAALPAIYNRYATVLRDPLYRPEHEGLIAVLRPLFTTSFLIDDALAEAGHHGARQVVLSSASSKTAYATAWCLAQRGDVKLVGLTSSRNLDFVRRLGVYHEVVAYDALASIGHEPAVYVDFAGRPDLRRAVHEHFGDALVCSTAVGATDWQHLANTDRRPLPGAKPQFFFAPTQAEKRLAEWGREGFGVRLGGAWTGFTAAVLGATPPWLTLREASGREGIEAAYREVLDGRLPADVAVVLRLAATA